MLAKLQDILIPYDMTMTLGQIWDVAAGANPPKPPREVDIYKEEKVLSHMLSMVMWLEGIEVDTNYKSIKLF